MNNIDLNTKDLNTIKGIMNKYNNVHDEIAEVEDRMEELHNKTDDLVEILYKIRATEGKFFSELESKYGEGTFDAVEMKWRIKTK